jgi:hypothetical protein
MTDLQKQTIRDLHETSSESQKEALRESFPEAFELQNGVWYTYTDAEDYLIKFTDVDNRMAFGFSPLTGWSSKNQNWDVRDLVEADVNYIATILRWVMFDEKKLTEGRRVKTTSGTYATIEGECHYDCISDQLVTSRLTVIFDGKEWAEQAVVPTRMSKEVAGQKFNIEIID